ncbi:MAG: hypothetical protein KF884_02880 [Fimbriimonadaceae bacterium]|nr:hypothetical protein [Fimbriimonadaceae bacterium]QYK59041.1 MAG: hypothetical protein KF884_02880 [Fimbriimonadaceae bacterium]
MFFSFAATLTAQGAPSWLWQLPSTLGTSMVVSTDGKLLALLRENVVTLWDLTTNRHLNALTAQTDGMLSIDISHDGTTAATTTYGGQVRLWDIATGSIQNILIGHTGPVRCVKFSPDGSTLASGDANWRVRLWNWRTGSFIRQLNGPTNAVNSVAFSPDGATLVAGADDSRLRIWDVATGTPGRTLSGHSNPVASVDFSPDGNSVVSGSSDGTIRQWNWRTGAVRHVLAGHLGGIRAVTYSPDGSTLASASTDHTVKLWDANQGVLLTTLDGHSNHVVSANFAPNGDTLFTASLDTTVRLWDAPTASFIRLLSEDFGSFSQPTYVHEGRTLLTTSGQLTFWDIQTGTPLRRWGPTYGSALAIAPDRRTLATQVASFQVGILDASSGALLQTLPPQNSSTTCLAYSQDGDTLVLASDSSPEVKLYDASLGTLIRTLTHSHSISSLSFTPDYSLLVVGTGGGYVHFWDWRTGDRVHTISNLGQSAKSIAFSFDGNLMAVAASNITFWDWRRKSLVQTISNLWSAQSVAFSPDGGKLAVAQINLSAPLNIFDVRTGSLLSWYGERVSTLYKVAYSPDGTTIMVTGSVSGLIRNPFNPWRPPLDCEVRKGTVRYGGAASLSAADGETLYVYRSSGRVPEVSVEVEGLSPTLNPYTLQFRVVSRSTRPETQRIQLWNWQANDGQGGWDPVDVRTDVMSEEWQSVHLKATGSLTRYVRTDGRMRARYSSIAPLNQVGSIAEIVHTYEHEADQAGWIIGE